MQRQYIGETLKSVLRQTWPEIEVIVVDDGSQDGSIAEIEKFRGAGVTLLRQANSGAGAARNRALRTSNGDFVQFLDADDLIEVDKIERQMRRLVEFPRCVASAEWSRFYGSPRKPISTLSQFGATWTRSIGLFCLARMDLACCFRPCG